MHSNRNLVIGGLLLAAVVCLSCVLFIVPNYREAKVTRLEVKELHARIAGLEVQNQLLAELKAKAAAARDRVEKEFKIIPESPDVASVIRKLSQDVDRVTVMDQTFTAGSASDAIAGGKSKVQAMPLTVDMDATFDSIFALIQNAESFKRLVRVVSVRILCKRDDKQPDNTVLKASVGLEAIYEPPVQANAAGGREGS